MNAATFTYLLESPEAITAELTKDLRGLIDEFPYFQSAHALYLKGLKNQGSFSYNKALKVTAAHTTDRNVLFDYISSSLFSQNEISTRIKHQEQTLANIYVTDAEDVSLRVEQEEMAKAEHILNPDLFVEKKDSLMTAETPESVLKVGEPLEFDIKETHSFAEWLKLAAYKPIDRAEKTTTSKTVVPEEVAGAQNEAVIVEPAQQDLAKMWRKRKEEIINSFIETNPKIKVSPSGSVVKKRLEQTVQPLPEALMTETLARVYLEQKNYKKARLAYRILSLKYPEKSGFFADQIRAIQELEENKEL